ncbi:hypothetical protein EJ08DRAFT_704149 [Tothia fuscella]|uniref:Uncharacterized protein n=1 Tax=Tothia fuscella TaxID=1048955 RepID=A0A9P4P3M7_9PEZI|nr:hypothetical protein EJ08DRAFT_704149 [Tothia fuscella]
MLAKYLQYLHQSAIMPPKRPLAAFMDDAANEWVQQYTTEATEQYRALRDQIATLQHDSTTTYDSVNNLVESIDDSLQQYRTEIAALSTLVQSLHQATVNFFSTTVKKLDEIKTKRRGSLSNSSQLSESRDPQDFLPSDTEMPVVDPMPNDDEADEPSTGLAPKNAEPSQRLKDTEKQKEEQAALEKEKRQKTKGKQSNAPRGAPKETPANAAAPNPRATRQNAAKSQAAGKKAK